MTMELENSDGNLTMIDILDILNTTLRIKLASDVMISKERFNDVQIVDTNQTKKSRADIEEISEVLLNATFLAYESGLDCGWVGCISFNETVTMIDLLRNQTDWAHILYVSFVMKEGPENETETDLIIAMMVSWIRQNSFQMNLDGLKIKFTTLRERNVHDEKDLTWWCKDGDLASYGNGEFSIVDANGRNWTNNQDISILKKSNNLSELQILTHKNKKIYKSENYVANILFQHPSQGPTTSFNVSGEVTVCENRSGD